MSTPTTAPAANLVITFRADLLEPILRNILHCLDAETRLLQRGNMFESARFRSAGVEQLHDLLAEVAS